MKRKGLFVFLALGLIAVLLAAACAQPTPTPTPTPPKPTPTPTPTPTPVKPIELSFGLESSPTHTRTTRVFEPWMKMVEERSNGRIVITPYYSNALAPRPENYNAAVEGIADIAECNLGGIAGRFPIGEMLHLPGVGMDTSTTGSRTIWRLLQKFPSVQAEYADTHVLTLFSYGSFAIMSTKPVHNLDDIKGLKLWSQGKPRNDTAVALGAVPVSMPMADAYMSIEKGVIDGLISDYTLLTSRKHGEVIGHITTGTSLGSAPFYLVMNKEKWNSLPPELQQVFNDLGGDWLAERMGGTFDLLSIETYAEWKDTVEFYTLEPAEAEKWVALLAPSRDAYIAGLEAKGIPAEDILAEMLRLGKEFGGAAGPYFPAEQP